MKSSAVCLLLASVGLFITPSFSHAQQRGAKASRSASSQEPAIRALVQKCVTGWNRGSGAAFAAQFAEDADYVVVNGMHLRGRRQIASAHQQIFDTFYKGTRLWVRIKSVRFLRPDVALVHTVGRVLRPGESHSSVKPESIQSFVVARQGSDWRIAAFHNTPLQEQSGQGRQP